MAQAVRRYGHRSVEGVDETPEGERAVASCGRLSHSGQADTGGSREGNTIDRQALRSNAERFLSPARRGKCIDQVREKPSVPKYGVLQRACTDPGGDVRS